MRLRIVINCILAKSVVIILIMVLVIYDLPIKHEALGVFFNRSS